MVAGKKTLEINGNHPVVHDMLKKVQANEEDAVVKATAEMLFQTAMIESGYEIQDPSDLASRVYRMMSQSMGVDPEATYQEVELPEDEPEEAKEKTTEEEEEDSSEEEVVEEAEEEKATPAEEEVTPVVTEEETPATEECAASEEEPKRSDL